MSSGYDDHIRRILEIEQEGALKERERISKLVEKKYVTVDTLTNEETRSDALIGYLQALSEVLALIHGDNK